MVQWAWSYFSYQRAIRLITGSLPELDADVSTAASTAERLRPERPLDKLGVALSTVEGRGAKSPSVEE
jgi:hypothetical protein